MPKVLAGEVFLLSVQFCVLGRRLVVRTRRGNNSQGRERPGSFGQRVAVRDQHSYGPCLYSHFALAAWWPRDSSASGQVEVMNDESLEGASDCNSGREKG